jgi:N-acetylgalactosamine kinase
MHDIGQLIKQISEAERQGADVARIHRALQFFSKEFPNTRDVFALRAPGRVNLIGEHTDYNGLPVLPIAINRDIMLIGAPRSDSGIYLLNTNESFGPRRFEVSESIPPYPAGDWGNYAKAAAQSLARHFFGTELCGFDAIVDGTIPMASGLSSSSALVVAFALAILVANERDIDRLQLAELLALGEHYVGTRGGGMDQAVCLLARAGHAVKIDFFPLRAEQIPLPSGYRSVVCNSLVGAPKTASARCAYNLRAAETRIAASLVGRAVGEKSERRGAEIERLGDLCSDALYLSEVDIDTLLEQVLSEEPYSLNEAARQLEQEPRDFRHRYLSAFDKAEVESIPGLKLRSRARHVISEGRRVEQAAAALQNGRVQEFGRLMNESHQSCAADYEISTSELDVLVSIARNAGALGARLTGAGFGGCTINLVEEGVVERFVKVVEETYYREYIPNERPDLANLANQPDRIIICNAVDAAGELFL